MPSLIFLKGQIICYRRIWLGVYNSGVPKYTLEHETYKICCMDYNNGSTRRMRNHIPTVETQ